MTSEEKKEIAELIAASQQKNGLPNVGTVADWLFKALVAILLYYGSDIKTTVESLKADQQKSSVEAVYQQKVVEKLEKLLDEPRYTKNQHDSENAVNLDNIRRNTAELNARKDVIESNTRDIRELKYETSANAENISEILKILKSME